MTLDGDLDGLLRLSRQAEAYFHQVERQGGPEDLRALKRPVVILQGLSYWAIFVENVLKLVIFEGKELMRRFISV